MTLEHSVQENCNISDARDNGIYSICMLVLRLRNLHKWELGLDPWIESEPALLLDWIEAKENYWETIVEKSFQPLPLNGSSVEPFDLQPVNDFLQDRNLIYGAGYGRSMKAIFFLAEKLEEKEVEGCPVLILGKEYARDLAAPFALLQDGLISIRKDAFRYYLWDQIQEMRPSGQAAMLQAMSHYGLVNKNGDLDRGVLIENFDHIVEEEIIPYIHHEIGEKLERVLDSLTMKKVVSAFPDSAVEFLVRAVKDVLADTHPQGMLGHIISARKVGSLGFYLGFFGGLRRNLSPEIVDVYGQFLHTGDWDLMEKARQACRLANRERAEKFLSIVGRLEKETPKEIAPWVEKELLAPLGLELPQELR